ncbi:hypothetical protein ARMGADRAFT_1081921 [Armillaria gallica]|uniref:Uncharacterized protein n=1 Tax=Armillaria gallica TaxID=47427 RepID=A0A2H3DBJ0_ARMGA|nr:hypothetical protein ARMGADRAFT_1081921 [Armillaria gallica]
MTVSIKDSGDDVQTLPSPPLGSNTTSPSSPILLPPPPYSIDADETSNKESRQLYPVNSESMTVSHLSALTNYSRVLRAVAILSYLTVSHALTCLRFGTQEYSAQLMDVRKGEDGMRWCKEKSIIIQDFDIGKPGYCTVDVDNSVSAHESSDFRTLTVDFNEPSVKRCGRTSKIRDAWRLVQRLACRIEAHMSNHQLPWDNWREMCSATSADYDEHRFHQPSSCDHREFTNADGQQRAPLPLRAFERPHFPSAAVAQTLMDVEHSSPGL